MLLRKPSATWARHRGPAHADPAPSPGPPSPGPPSPGPPTPGPGSPAVDGTRYEQLWEALSSITVPVLLVRGMRPDSVLDDDDERELRRRASIRRSASLGLWNCLASRPHIAGCSERLWVPRRRLEMTSPVAKSALSSDAKGPAP
jgi:hypothetical protein